MQNFVVSSSSSKIKPVWDRKGKEDFQELVGLELSLETTVKDWIRQKEGSPRVMGNSG